MAQALHAHGHRQGPFVSVNLGALPKELAAAELFGSVRGAFTGAQRDREGFFQAARGGTLFLDEVGEASPEVQVLLLRVLETGEMYPVGASRPVATQVRLVAATDADLEAQMADGRFRAPLLHRLAGCFTRAWARASETKRRVSASSSPRTNLRATWRCSRGSHARNTRPMPT